MMSAGSSTRGSRFAQAVAQFLQRVALHVRALAAIAVLVGDEIELSCRGASLFERMLHAALGHDDEFVGVRTARTTR